MSVGAVGAAGQANMMASIQAVMERKALDTEKQGIQSLLQALPQPAQASASVQQQGNQPQPMAQALGLTGNSVNLLI